MCRSTVHRLGWTWNKKSSFWGLRVVTPHNLASSNTPVKNTYQVSGTLKALLKQITYEFLPPPPVVSVLWRTPGSYWPIVETFYHFKVLVLSVFWTEAEEDQPLRHCTFLAWQNLSWWWSVGHGWWEDLVPSLAVCSEHMTMCTNNYNAFLIKFTVPSECLLQKVPDFCLTFQSLIPT